MEWKVQKVESGNVFWVLGLGYAAQNAPRSISRRVTQYGGRLCSRNSGGKTRTNTTGRSMRRAARGLALVTDQTLTVRRLLWVAHVARDLITDLMAAAGLAREVRLQHCAVVEKRNRPPVTATALGAAGGRCNREDNNRDRGYLRRCGY